MGLQALDAKLRNLLDAVAPPKVAPAPLKPAAPAKPLRANLAEIATVSALRFDPARLYQEFGRERVLAFKAAGYEPRQLGWRIGEGA